MDYKHLVEKYKLNKDDFWKHGQSGKWIISHDSVEKIANQEKIQLGGIQPLNSTETLVRFLVSMKKGDKVVTSVGEADTKNCRNAYLGCMAEKRGIDRCVLKLINAYQYGIYSDVEADNFARPQYEHRTEEQAQEFDSLKKHEALVGKKAEVNKEWKSCNSIKEYESVLRRMRKSVETFENEKADEINQDLDNQVKEKINE
tara:strand:- start:1699 stop:2301 length:603 start_codon:yes stop_codon:yes gene_type:complete